MYSNLFVCLFGMGTVFFGLVCIVFLTMLISYVCRHFEKEEAAPAKAPVPAAAPAVPAVNEEELKEAAAAAIAEELGVRIERIQIVSMKKV